MRISDWSSDVCSSDLNGVDLSSMHDDGEAALETYLTGLNSIPVPKPVTALAFDAGARCATITAVRKLLITHLHCYDTGKCFQGDRKSVVEGKSVSVRLDLGGRGYIKKPKQI